MPLDLVVKASNSRSAFSAATPTPQSLRNQNLAGLILRVPDHQLARPVLDRLHRFDPVDDEVEDDLLQLDPVGEDQRAGVLQPQRHPMAEQLMLHEADDLVDDVIDLERRLRSAVLSTSARTRWITSPARLPSATIDCRVPRASFRLAGSRSSQRRHAAALGDDGGERLVHFMGDRRGELAQRSHARDMREVRQRFMQFRFGSLAGGDVRHRSDKFDLARRICYRMRGGMDMFDRAVGHQQSISVREVLPSRDARSMVCSTRARSSG